MTKSIAVMNPIPEHTGALRRAGHGRQHASGAISVRQALAFVVVLTILFPYIRLLPLSTDVQPNFLIAVTLFSPLMLTVRNDELLILVGILCLLLLYTIADPVPESIRAWPAYLTPPIMLMFTRTLLSRRVTAQMLETLIWRSFLVWVGFGVLQFLTRSSVLELTLRASTTDDRGWMSFASEPSAFGTVLFLFAAYFVANRSYGRAVIALLTTLVVAQSAVGLVYFTVLALAWSAVRAHNHVLLVVFLAIVAVIVALSVDFRDLVDHLPEGRRVARLIEMSLSADAWQDDASIGSRASDLVEAFDALASGSPLGHGLGGEIRLKSGWGAYIYELGWIGFMLAIGWIGFFLRAAARVNRDVFAATVAIIVMLFSSTPLAMPAASFIIMAMILAPTAPVPPPRRRLRFRRAHA